MIANLILGRRFSYAVYKNMDLGWEKHSCSFVSYLHLAQSAPHSFLVAGKRFDGCAFLMNEDWNNVM